MPLGLQDKTIAPFHCLEIGFLVAPASVTHNVLHWIATVIHQDKSRPPHYFLAKIKVAPAGCQVFLIIQWQPFLTRSSICHVKAVGRPRGILKIEFVWVCKGLCILALRERMNQCRIWMLHKPLVKCGYRL